MSADMRGEFQMEQSPHSSDGSEIFTNDQQGSRHEHLGAPNQLVINFGLIGKVKLLICKISF